MKAEKIEPNKFVRVEKLIKEYKVRETEIRDSYLMKTENRIILTLFSLIFLFFFLSLYTKGAYSIITGIFTIISTGILIYSVFHPKGFETKFFYLFMKWIFEKSIEKKLLFLQNETGEKLLKLEPFVYNMSRGTSWGTSGKEAKEILDKYTASIKEIF